MSARRGWVPVALGGAKRLRGIVEGLHAQGLQAELREQERVASVWVHRNGAERARALIPELGPSVHVVDEGQAAYEFCPRCGHYHGSRSRCDACGEWVRA